MKFLTRTLAAEFLNNQFGLRTSTQGLANKAHAGAGPRYAIVNGRAVYTEEDLIGWVAEQSALPVIRRSQRNSAQAA